MCDRKKINNISANVDIDLANDYVTQKSTATLLLSIVEFLLFNRNQIPFVYQTFNYMTKRLEKAKSAHNENDANKTFIKNYALERQRDVAIQTYRKFNEISDVLIKSFEKHEMEQAIIMFGATTFTSKEAFIINLPPVSKDHFAANHPNAAEIITRKVIRSIITSKNFFDVNCSGLKPTNMFVILKPKNGISSIGNEFVGHSNFKFPTSCRTTHINIGNEPMDMPSNCCRGLNIFSDNESSSYAPIASDTSSGKMGNCNNRELKNGIGKENLSSIPRFYECNIVVKGFKDQLIKGQSIWANQEPKLAAE